MIEKIKDKEEEIATIVYRDSFEERVKFITPDDFPLQFGIMKYEEGDSVHPHTHPNLPRVITQSQEIIHVVEGKIKLDIFNSKGELCASKILKGGDSAFFAKGGRGWTALEETRMIEIKQGPYLGEKDKVLL